MRHTILYPVIWVLTFAIGLSISAVWSTVNPPTEIWERARAEEQELLRLEDEYLAAEKRADVQFFDRIYTRDFSLTYSDGTILNRSEALEEIAAAEGLYREMYHTDVEVLLTGDVGIVTGRWTGVGEDEDGEFTEHTKWKDVFVKVDGQWLLQSTLVIGIDGDDVPSDK